MNTVERAPIRGSGVSAMTFKTQKSVMNTDLWNLQVNSDNSSDKRYISNDIRTSKYTAITFVPKNLFE